MHWTTRVIVVGGGIGGLATALSAARQGHHVVVLERRDRLEELGAGIQLGPNAFRALDRLGVGGAVRDKAVFIDELRLMDGITGERIVRMPLTDRYRARFGNPYAVVHRSDLYQPLLDACRTSASVELLTGLSVIRYEQNDDEVTAVTATGRRLTGAALIGADGIRSTIRRQLVGDGEPQVSGHTIYRSVVPMNRVPDDLRWNCVTLWAGPKWHFVHYAIAGGALMNLAATKDDGAQEVVAGRPVEASYVLNEFSQLEDAAQRLLKLGEDWRTWVLCDRDPVDVWTDGRVALLGDAAHPMLQYAAQGACMALEDAVVIGESLGCQGHEVPGRLEKYNTWRRDRTRKAQLLAREMGSLLYHPAGQAAVARNAMLSSFTEDGLYDAVSWLHGDRDFIAGGAR
ncbi:3-hydroxybenzoate 6-monooxygenase [Streptomyces sp. AM 4-1-1]|uniref:3-hydroxybenzoate 6-monooxygenase n=1 Tax=Streptomyces sp. AM 4-1-1 TaxID=3028710 RepID=UPI0023B8AEA9|nr:3-hydroxybenzoate 6-monooxygenase [Streptomyces sp. AM 4-1-1]WEH36694.1 3-hydroxybenzoate 6-monooxygenase [Streptomyces sp. AM 4-1-1]